MSLPVRARNDPAPVRARNDPAQYDDLAEMWWDRRGRFAMLHWIAEARSSLLPPAPPGALAVDLGCGGGLMAPYVARAGYRHVGVDLSGPALREAAARGVLTVRADVRQVPLRDGVADVVLAGEILEHVPDMPQVIAECARILRPGGTLVVDTIAATAFGRFTSITLGERLPGGPPPRLHDGDLFVDRRQLVGECARHGIDLRLQGLRLSLRGYLLWLARRRPSATFKPTRLTAGLFQGVGVKAAA